MTEIKGEYNTAIVYTDKLEDSAAGQIKALCDSAYFADCQIRVMPDVHAGAGCTIGTTMTITDKAVPNMVGVDIGCGMETVKIKETEVNFDRLDRLIRRRIPSGRNVRPDGDPHRFHTELDLRQLRCAAHVNLDRAESSVGTLGGGNHFIEVDRDDSGAFYLIIHSGSRHLGKEVAEYYQNEGFAALCGTAKFQMDVLMADLRSTGQTKVTRKQVKEAKRRRAEAAPVPKPMAYVQGALFSDYIHDMKITQRFAVLNRKAIVDEIMNGMKWTEEDHFTTIHNYIDTEEKILRKGAVAAHTGQKLLIPINMRDGSLLCVGKGNADWNYSAPHGAGRIMSRKEAHERLNVEDFTRQMKGIYTTCIGRGTLDEAPMAYKNMEEIMRNIEPTAEILQIIKPVYNFKAQE